MHALVLVLSDFYGATPLHAAGCSEYLLIALGLGLVFLVLNLHLVWHVKERPCKNLSDEAEGFIPSKLPACSSCLSLRFMHAMHVQSLFARPQAPFQ